MDRLKLIMYMYVNVYLRENNYSIEIEQKLIFISHAFLGRTFHCSDDMELVTNIITNPNYIDNDTTALQNDDCNDLQALLKHPSSVTPTNLWIVTIDLHSRSSLYFSLLDIVQSISVFFNNYFLAKFTRPEWNVDAFMNATNSFLNQHKPSVCQLHSSTRNFDGWKRRARFRTNQRHQFSCTLFSKRISFVLAKTLIFSWMRRIQLWASVSHQFPFPVNCFCTLTR